MIAATRALLLAFLAIGLLTPEPANCQTTSTTVRNQWPKPREVDERRASVAGIRMVEGRHLRLYTDVPSSPAIDELPAVFDAAVAQWAEYFKLPQRQFANWKVQGFLARDRARFGAIDLLPDKNRDYINGYAYGYELWLDDQPSDYYRRHLLLHEGVHSFMLTLLGSGGPGWYMEGIAELLGTHRWDGQRLEVNVIPSSREELPMWGRIRLIREAQQQGKELSIDAVLAIDNRRPLDTDAYAWCWSFAKFLDSHPHHSTKFRELRKLVARDDFNRRFRRMFQSHWSDLNAEWEAFIATLDYGYNPTQMSVVHQEAQPISQSSSTPSGEASVFADRGWQSSGWLLEAGTRYHVSAQGRYQIAGDSEPWPCEPGGVTLRYHEGEPLGILLGALRPLKDNPRQRSNDDLPNGQGFLHPIAIGLEREITPLHDAILYLRVNRPAAELADNEGSLQATISVVDAVADGD